MQDEAGAPLIAADDPSPPSTPTPTRRRHLFLILGAAAVLAYVADQATKLWALHSLVPGRPVSLVGDFLRLNLIRNAGAAFSIGNGNTWVMTLIAFGVLIFIIRTASRIGSIVWAVVLGLLLGGSLGNLTDRMLREPGPGRGHVVDFIDYFGLFIGNVADIAIVGAAAVIAVLAMRGIGVDGRRPHQGRHEAGHAAKPAEGQESAHG
jgi:signal peptidase II